MSGWTVIAHQELQSDQAKFTFSNIPQTYTDLYILISTRSAFSGGGTPYTVIAPNGSLLNLTFRRLYGNGTSPFSDTAPYSVPTPSSLDTANAFSNGSIYIPNYTSSNNKSLFQTEVSISQITQAVITNHLALMLWMKIMEQRLLLRYKPAYGHKQQLLHPLKFRPSLELET